MIAVDARDWATLPATPEYQAILQGVPGKRLQGKKLQLHRTHLPLIGLSPQFPLASPLGESPLPILPRPWQPEGAQFIRDRRSTILADQQRLGKTYTVCMAHDPAEGQLVVVAPLATRSVWEHWFRVCFPGKSIGIASGLEYDPALFENDLVFIHYDILDYATMGRRAPAMAVLDEGHVLSNRNSKRTQAAHRIAGKAKRVVVTSGTPAWNRPLSVYPMLQILSPGAWGSYSAYAFRYAEGSPGQYGLVAKGSSHEEEMKLRLSELMLRRTWNDLKEFAPQTQKDVQVIELSFDEKIAIDTELGRAREASEKEKTEAGEYARLRRILGQSKVDQVVSWVDRHQGEPLVVWTWHNDLGKDILARIEDRPAYRVDGKIKPLVREAFLDSWRSSEDGILVISLAVGQAGIDLSHSRRALFAEQDWTPAVLSQAEFRTYSPARPDFLTYLVTDHPLDLKVLRTVLEKATLSRRIGMPASESSFDVFQEAMQVDIPTGSDIVDWIMAGF